MGIDLLRGGRTANRGVRQTKTTNTYIKTLIKLYSFLQRRTDCKFNKTIHKRLNQSRLNRYPISLSRISRILSKDRLFPTEPKAESPTILGKVANVVTRFFKKSENKSISDKPDRFASRIVAVVGTVTNDNRLVNFPKGVKICALKFTNAARARVLKAGGETLTFDQLAQIAPTGRNVLLLRGPRDREAKRHFGLYPGQRGSHTAPRVRTEGRKFERARGRR